MLIFIYTDYNLSIQNHTEKSSRFHHDEGDYFGTKSDKWKVQLQGVRTWPVPNRGIDDRTVLAPKAPVKLNAKQTYCFVELLRYLEQRFPDECFSIFDRLWDIHVNATHGTLGRHVDELFHDGSGCFIISISIHGRGVEMAFFRNMKSKVAALRFPLQHGDIVMFKDKARFQMLHEIEIPKEGTTDTTMLLLLTALIMI